VCDGGGRPSGTLIAAECLVHSVKQRLVLFWSALLVGIAILLVGRSIPIIDEHRELSQWVVRISVHFAVIVFGRLYQRARPPRWLRVWGYVTWLGGFAGIPFIAISRGPDAFPPLFLVCLASAATAFLLAFTIHTWRQGDGS